MKKMLLPVTCLLVVFVLAGCGTAVMLDDIPLAEEAYQELPEEQPVSSIEVLNLDFGMFGDISALPYMEAFTDAYLSEYEGASLDFAVVSRDEALELLESGDTQIAVLTGDAPGGVPVAYLCIGIAVHPDNPLSDVSRKQLFDIFSGDIANWADLGFSDAPITLYVTESNTASRQTFEDTLSLKSSEGISRSLIPDHAAVISDENLVGEAVANDINAIGIVAAAEDLGAVKILTIESAMPSSDGSYLLSSPIVMVGSDMDALTDFAKTPKMQGIVRTLGLWPIN